MVMNWVGEQVPDIFLNSKRQQALIGFSGRGRSHSGNAGWLLGLSILHLDVLSILGDERRVGMGPQRNGVLETTTSTCITSTENQTAQAFLRFRLRVPVEVPVASVVVLLIRSLLIHVTPLVG